MHTGTEPKRLRLSHACGRMNKSAFALGDCTPSPPLKGEWLPSARAEKSFHRLLKCSALSLDRGRSRAFVNAGFA